MKKAVILILIMLLLNINYIYADFVNNTNENVIKLENPKSESIKSEKSIIYESKNELIKKYSIYGFLITIAIMIMMLIFTLKKWIK